MRGRRAVEARKAGFCFFQQQIMTQPNKLSTLHFVLDHVRIPTKFVEMQLTLEFMLGALLLVVYLLVVTDMSYY